MTAYAVLRARLRDWPKYPGGRPEPRAPLMTPGFPGTFNLSFTEHHWLRAYGGYLDWPHHYAFTTIQTCARAPATTSVARPEGASAGPGDRSRVEARHG